MRIWEGTSLRILLSGLWRSVKYLISQNSECPLQSAGRSVLGGSGKPLGIVADLSLQRVDVGDDLFGSDDVLGYVDDGLRAGEGAAAENKHTWL